MAEFFNNLINTIGGTQIAGLVITSIIAITEIKSSDKTFYYYNNYLKLINDLLKRKIKNSPEKKESLLKELTSCQQLLEKD